MVSEKKPYKSCGCGRSWADRQAWLATKDLTPIGMQYFPPEEDLGPRRLFMVNCPCGSTLAVDADDFLDLIGEPTDGRIGYQTESCEGHCQKVHDLATCSADCANAAYRRFLVRWSKMVSGITI